ncbi:MAG: AEC family transporter [Desulfovibrionaceae bacterium]|nr:AEC family transporter [Desulfovibrionaceae bacterium]
MLLSNVFSAVAMVCCIASLGFFLKRKGRVHEGTARALPNFMTNIVLPPFLLHNVTQTFSYDQLFTLLAGSLLPVLSIFLCFGMALAGTYIFSIPASRRGAFTAAVTSSNTVYMGLPVNIALFGEGAVQYVLLYVFANNIFFWSLGNYCIAHDGDGKDVKLFSLKTVKQIFFPPFTGFLVGVLLVVLDIPLPDFLDKTFKYIGDMSISLGIMYLGILLSDAKLKDFAPEKDTVLVIIGRFILGPLSIILLAYFIPVPDMMLKVFIIQSSLPVMLNVAVLTAYYRGDAKYAAILVSTSTVMTIVTVPLISLLIAFCLP